MLLAMLAFAGTGDAEAIETLRQMERKYAGLVAYSDYGQAQITFSGTSAPDTVIKVLFRTTYRRPDELHFTFTERKSYGPEQEKIRGQLGAPGRPDLGGIITASAGNVVVQLPPSIADKKLPTIRDAIELFMAPSSMTSYTVPNMLLGDAGQKGFLRLTDWTLSHPDTVDDVDCIGLYSAESSTRLWIGRKDHLLRRIRLTKTVDRDVSLTRVTDYHPKPL